MFSGQKNLELKRCIFISVLIGVRRRTIRRTREKGFSALVLYSLFKALKADCDYILTGSDKTANYDRQLAETLQLFNQCQAERINEILREIYKLL